MGEELFLQQLTCSAQITHNNHHHPLRFFFQLFPALLALARADADADPKAAATADASAEADADLPHHPLPHPLPHPHPAPHVPHYTPAPYTPAPPPYGYTPAPYAPHPHPAPHHASPYAPPHPPHPAPYGPPHPHEPHYAGPPACAKLLPNKPYKYCLEDPEYPTYEIQQAIEYNYDAVQQLYKDVLANTENSVDRLKDIVEETYLCPSETKYIQPLRAVNVHGKWRIIVNHVKAHYELLSQTARVEECVTPGSHCPLVPECYETKCLQKSIYHRFLVYDPYDKYLPFAIESFRLPSACACYNGAYVNNH